MKAGAGFLILDQKQPPRRLLECVTAARPRGWLQVEGAQAVGQELAGAVRELAGGCWLELPQGGIQRCRELLGGYSSQDPGVEIGGQDVAYVAFTSGTTGRPKGIVGTHGPVGHFLWWHSQRYGLKPSDRFSLLSGVSHDPLLREMMTPLWVGGRVCIPGPARLETGAELIQWMKQQEISVAHLTPALGQMLTGAEDGRAGRLQRLRYVFYGGDMLRWADVRRMQELAPGMECVNYYGATETPQAMGYKEVRESQARGERPGGRVPVGRGIDQVQLLVVNEAGQLAGVGEVGEIQVRSPHLARGYVGDERLTEERFIINRYTGRATDRVYKTGDVGRYLVSGEVEALGRRDRQVKIRGYRVELGEIEAVLEQHQGVKQAVVVAKEHRSGPGWLVAYVVGREAQTWREPEIRDWVRQWLPQYMQPAVYVQLEAAPLTPQGKVDRAALLAAPEAVPAAAARPLAAPQTAVEKELARIWADVLGLDRVGLDDDFFGLGGHSLLAAQIMSRIADTFDVQLPLRLLFDSPTLAGLAAAIEEFKDRRGEKAVGSFPRIEADRDNLYRPFPLRDIQQAYWVGRSGDFQLGNVATHLYLELESEALDLERFNLAWRRLIDRHDMLRAIVQPDGQQQILEQVPAYRIEVLDLWGKKDQ
ncbi:MAG TPA: AMP-binding protein, partial [Desulfurivibrionaceae bacterium]|nr:AMP-binding protein [Desulfurivibrionaceae bacterium]